MQSQSTSLVTIDTPIHLELIRIPAGEFLMGDDKHSVSLAEFYVSKYPVTNQQYEAFVQTNDCEFSQHWKWAHSPAGKENHPVVSISWDDAVAFCEWLSKEVGREFRLPTEAEWEKAARGTDGWEFPWGDEPPTKDLCNFGMNVGDTTPVGANPKGASPYGVLDMAGNVWEWTGSPYHQSGGFVVRGGCYFSGDALVRCADRYGDLPYYLDHFIGFRVVCVSPLHHVSGLRYSESPRA